MDKLQGFLGLIGFPLKLSLSPVIFEYWFKFHGLKADYQSLSLDPQSLDSFMKDNKIFGLNITYPYKEKIFSYCDDVSSAAQAIGAVNCLRYKDGKIQGENFDHAGFALALQAYDLRGKSALVIGAGGAARAVIYALKNLGLGRISVYNRSPQRLEDLQRDFPYIHPTNNLKKSVQEARVIINASNGGMQGFDPLPLEEFSAQAGQIFYDLVYRPLSTDFLQKAQREGAEIIHGLPMLIGQAALAFQWWFGISVPHQDPVLLDLLQTKL